MYAEGNPKTKKQLKQWVADHESGIRPIPVYAFQPGPFDGTANGIDCIEGPHYPKPHRWYARCEIRNGIIVRVVS